MVNAYPIIRIWVDSVSSGFKILEVKSITECSDVKVEEGFSFTTLGEVDPVLKFKFPSVGIDVSPWLGCSL